MPIRVLLADDSEIIRRAIRGLFENTEIELIAETDDLSQAVRLTNELKPQVVLIDLHMTSDDPGLCDVKPRLSSCDAQLVAISFANDEDAKMQAKAVGAVALLDKAELADELIPTIKTFASGANRLGATD